MNEAEAMAALRRLIGAGFIGKRMGDPDDPGMLLYQRVRHDIGDNVLVFGPGECEAARIVHGKIVLQASGATPAVVDAVLKWSMLTWADGTPF